jgi:hypothetical protein
MYRPWEQFWYLRANAPPLVMTGDSRQYSSLDISAYAANVWRGFALSAITAPDYLMKLANISLDFNSAMYAIQFIFQKFPSQGSRTSSA